MKRHTFRSRRMVGFFRAGYPADAPQRGHMALLAMCPAAAGVVRPSASSGFANDRRASRSFPLLDPEVYDIVGDEQLVLDLLLREKILVTQGTRFN